MAERRGVEDSFISSKKWAVSYKYRHYWLWGVQIEYKTGGSWFWRGVQVGHFKYNPESGYYAGFFRGKRPRGY